MTDEEIAAHRERKQARKEKWRKIDEETRLKKEKWAEEAVEEEKADAEKEKKAEKARVLYRLQEVQRVKEQWTTLPPEQRQAIEEFERIRKLKGIREH